MTATFRRLIHLLLFAALLLPGLAASAQLGQEQVTPAIIAKAGSIQPGEPFTAAVRFDIRDKWHLYWTNPEGDGFAPEVNWNLPEGYTVSKARWPAPHTFEFLGGIQFGYENELTLLFDITAPADAAGQAVVLQAELTWLVCDSGNCVPNKGYPDPITVERVLPISGEAPKPSADSALIEAAEQQVPGSAEGWSFNTERTGAGFILTINTPSEADAKEIDGLYFYSSEQFAVDPQAEQAAEVKGKAVQLKLTERKTDPYGDPIEREQPITTLNGVLTAKSGFGDTGLSAMIVGAYTSAPAAANTPDPNDAPLTTTQEPVLGFMVAIGFAFVGGLILNLMPCVFPVLSIKILGFVNQAGENPAIVRRHGYAFGIGVLLSFWALVAVLLILRSIAQAAAESSGATAGSVGWGFQLQEPAFVLAMLMLVFLIGLNLIGAFEVGIGLSAAAGKASQTSKDGYGKSFLTGVLATLIATPCTGPFMAPALGAAIAMPTYQAILVFTALGIGMATPYVVLSCFPALLNYLPRPGAWMESFKQAMAFPMFATAGWLAWVYIGLTSDDFGLVILICLSIVALGAWVYGRWSTPIRSTRTRWIARIVALVFVAGGIGYIHIGASAIEAQRIAAQMAREAGEYVYEWVDYSPEKVAALRETGRPVLIDFTAKWCATCQVNKRTSLRTSAAQKLYKQYNVALVEADNTRPNPDIVKTLEQHQRAGVPLYLVFPAGDPDAAPQVLPEVLTPQMVEDAIKQAADANEGDSPVAVNR
ncbi:MAG: thioredoxin family protein [Phycisphaeraceae bacterium]|nr:thioredoxin family protein [Phycisphaeraceae bacterium]